MSASSMTVRDLRRLWKPHKERLGDHPTAVRFHRACSWLDQAEKFQNDESIDVKMIHQWIAFNALYGQWDAAYGEPAPDRQGWKALLARIIKIDAAQHVAGALVENKKLAAIIVGDKYLQRRFWREPNSKAHGSPGTAAAEMNDLIYRGEWLRATERLMEAVYLLRCQLMHGAATSGGRMNRLELKNCTRMMDHLIRAILLVWIEKGADEDWGEMCYPPVAKVGSSAAANSAQ
ncbi:MAG TPA: hypothetical protein VNC50_14440 [Planctomycetia bacterium]|nr:hypothetical protein [Planctomycetia bacterium]